MKKILLILAVLAALVIPRPAGAQGTCAIFRSWTTGNSLTAPDLTTSFITVGQTNMIPACMQGDSVTLGGMQTTQDPWPAGTESLAGDIKGEIERLRFVIGATTGRTQWYQYPSVALTASGSVFSQAPRWNNGAVTFPGLWLLNVTDTASLSGSLLLDLQVGSTSKFKVDKAGNVTATGTISGASGAGTFTTISVTNNTNEILLGTTNIGTFTLAGGALTGARTWTLPDISGIVALTNGGQTFTSGVWNGSIVGTTFGGTGIDTHLTAAGSILSTTGTGTWAAATAAATGTVLMMGGSSTAVWNHTGPLMYAVFN
jgi:hypothetical protein